MREITNARCALYHTKYCDLLNMRSCDTCFVNNAKEYETTLRDLDVLVNLLPEEPLHTLFTDTQCQFCKYDPKGKREYYGLVDMGHPEPKRHRRNVIGIKTQAQVGSLVPLQIGTCKKCRNRMLMLEYLPVLLPLVTGLVTLFLLMIRGVSDSLERIAQILPFLVFVGAILLAFGASSIVRRQLRKKYRKEMAINVREIPLVRKMLENGWFFLNQNGNVPRIVFTRKRMRSGICTGTPEDATVSEYREPAAPAPYQPKYDLNHPQ